MTDLLIRGGIVVTAGGRRRADVSVEGGKIRAVEADLGGLAEGAAEVVDAAGLLILPGAVDVHTHTRVASDTEPDRFFRDSVAAAFGGTTSFLAFNNPGTGASEAAGRSLLAGLREWRTATNEDSAIDYGVSLAVTGGMDDPIAELPAVVEAGVSTCKAFMVFDFRLPEARLYEAIRTMGTHGGMLEVHCEDPVLIDAAVASALQRGNTLPRYHAETRPSYAEGIATARAIGFARLADAPLHVVHLSSRDALRFVREAKAAGQRVSAETCPHYLALTDERYLGPDDATVAGFVISPPLRTAADQRALWEGTLGRRPRSRRHGPRSRSSRHRKGGSGPGPQLRQDLQRRARDRDAARDRVFGRGREGTDHARADDRRPRNDARPALRFPLERRYRRRIRCRPRALRSRGSTNAPR
jgi:dihydropyrimidinase